MNPARELNEVIVHLKTILSAYGEMGLDLPRHRPDGSPCAAAAERAQEGRRFTDLA